MLSFLLDIYNSGVSSSTTSSDGVFDGVAKGLDFDTTAFLIGIIVGIIITLATIGMVKYIKFLLKENKEMDEKLSSKKNDE